MFGVAGEKSFTSETLDRLMGGNRPSTYLKEEHIRWHGSLPLCHLTNQLAHLQKIHIVSMVYVLFVEVYWRNSIACIMGFWRAPTFIASWWFQIFVMFTPILGEILPGVSFLIKKASTLTSWMKKNWLHRLGDEMQPNYIRCLMGL